VKKNIHIVIISLLFSIILWVSISLSNDYYITVHFPVKIVNFHEGYASGTKLPSKISAKIKGTGWKLLSLSLGSESEYLVSAGGDTGRKYINLYNSLSENQWLATDMQVIDLSPDTLSIRIEKIGRKKVKIDPDLSLNFKSGYGLADNIQISPESTYVSGPISHLKDLTSVPTEKKTLSDLDSKIVDHVSLKDIRGMSYDQNLVTINLDVQKIVDKNFDDIPVSVLDLPSDREVVLLPNRISVGVRGGVNILGKLNEDQFKAYVYYRDVVLDTVGSVIPQVEFPQNTSIMYVKPERLRYIIKKYK
jgi:YbbR domain-containing protein